jgi:HK97 family phage major capsid protein
MVNPNHLKKNRALALDRMDELLRTGEERTNKTLTAAEEAEFNKCERQARLLAEQIDDAERGYRAAGFGGGYPGAGGNFVGPQEPGFHGVGRHFSTLGEQLATIAEAGRTGGRVDQRLHDVAVETRAATGMGESIPSEGGFVLESTFSTDLLSAGMAAAKIAPRCRPFPVGPNSNSISLPTIDETSRATGSRGGALRLYWLPEGGEKLASKPKLKMLQLSLKKLAGLCWATDELLADSTALEAFIRAAFAAEFSFVVDDCVLRGTGAGQPLGVLASAALVTQAKEGGQAQKTITATNVLTMYSRLLAGSVDTACWFYNMDAFPQLASMTITAGTAGQPMFVPAGGLSGKPYNTLLGLPLIPLEQCATLGQPGDLVLMDPQRYILATRGGLQTASSIHVRFTYDETVFRFVYRIDGQPELSSVIVPYQGTATQSAYIVLEERK